MSEDKGIPADEEHYEDVNIHGDVAMGFSHMKTDPWEVGFGGRLWEWPVFVGACEGCVNCQFGSRVVALRAGLSVRISEV